MVAGNGIWSAASGFLWRMDARQIGQHTPGRDVVGRERHNPDSASRPFVWIHPLVCRQDTTNRHGIRDPDRWPGSGQQQSRPDVEGADGVAGQLTVLIDGPRGTISNVVRYELLDEGRTLRAVEDVGGAAPSHHNVWMFARR